MTKIAKPNHPIAEAISHRWSPYGFDDRPVPEKDLLSILEAARWAPSAFNEQPWRYIIGIKEQPDSHARVLSCLVEANQAWARMAPVLMLSVAATTYAHNGKPNGTFQHDLGLAAANLSAEATVRGISVHQMAGILPDRARELFGIPPEFAAITGLALGYAADPDTLDNKIKERDTAPRSRRPLEETVFQGRWAQAPEWIGRD